MASQRQHANGQTPPPRDDLRKSFLPAFNRPTPPRQSVPARELLPGTAANCAVAG